MRSSTRRCDSADLAPREAEVWSLSALVHLHASRAAARADLLVQLGRTAEVRAELSRAATLTDNARAAALAAPAP